MRRLFAFSLALTVSFGMAMSAQADVIGWYNFDTDFADSSGLGNDGAASGDAALTGLLMGVDGVGGAAQFGGGGHVVVPIDSNASANPNMTVTMWVKADSSIVSANGKFKTFGHDDGGFDRAFGLDDRSGVGHNWSAFTGGGVTGPTTTPVTDEWTFLATVFQADMVTVYAGKAGESNASVMETANYAGGSGQTTSAIGNLSPANFSEGWVGLIDNVTIHNSALSAAEIDQWKLTTSTVPEPTMAGLLAMGLVGLGLKRRRF